MEIIECIIANPLIETFSQVILDVFASCGRITAQPEVIPRTKWGNVRSRPPGATPFLDPARFYRPRRPCGARSGLWRLGTNAKRSRQRQPAVYCHRQKAKW